MPHLKKFLIQDKLIDYNLSALRKDIVQVAPQTISLFVEHSHVTREAIKLEIIEAITSLEKWLVTLHVTDQHCYNNYDLCLKAQLAIYAKGNYTQIVQDAIKL